MSFTQELQITDPDVMRALAHPARSAILGRLNDGPATATECAEVAGESPSGCSYHLRKLRDLGFVEETPSKDGRERRWRLVVRGYTFDVGASPEQRAASSLLRAHNLELTSQRLRAYLETEGSFDQRWIEAALFMTSELYLAPDELLELYVQMRELLDPYFDRASNSRPPGAKRISFHMHAVPLVDRGNKGDAARTRKEVPPH